MSLDLKQFYEYYDEYKNKKDTAVLTKIATMLNDKYNEVRSLSQKAARTAEECTRFVEGDQYIYYNENTNTYDRIPENKFTDFIPRQIVNIILPVRNAIVSLLTKNKPDVTIIENSDMPADKNRAKIAKSIQEAKWIIDDEEANYTLAAEMAVDTPIVYRKDYWDTTGSQTLNIPTKDTEGKEETREVPLGDNKVKILSLFEVFPDVDNAINSLDDGDFILEAQAKATKWIKDSYDRKGAGFTGLAKEVDEDSNVNTMLSYIEKFKGKDEGKSKSGKAVLLEAYIRPDREHKKGVTVHFTQNKCLFIEDTIYTDDDDSKDWHPYTMYRYMRKKFSHYGSCLVEHLISLQRQRNSIEALKILNRQTMAVPQWLIPNGSMAADEYITGEPGLNIPYDVVGQDAPNKVPGIGLDASVYKEEEGVKQAMHEIAGDNQVLQGIRPQGVETAAMMGMMIEQSNSVHSVRTQTWERFIKDSQTKKINLIRRKYNEPRKDIINKVKALNLENKTVEIEDTFTGKDLGDRIDIRIEAGSSLPKLHWAQTNQIMDIYAKGLYGDLSPQANPIGNRELLRKMGLAPMPEAADQDVKRALAENDLLRQGKAEEAKVMPIDNHVIHLKVLFDDIKRPEFTEANAADIVKLYSDHAMEHFLRLDPPQKALLAQMCGLSAVSMREIETVGNIYGIMGPEVNTMPVIQRINNLEDQVGQLTQFAQAAMSNVMQMPQPGMNEAVAPGGQPGVEASVPASIPGNSTGAADNILGAM